MDEFRHILFLSSSDSVCEYPERLPAFVRIDPDETPKMSCTRCAAALEKSMKDLRKKGEK